MSGRLKFTSGMRAIDYEYYRTYPHPLKRKYCKVLSVLDRVASRYQGRQNFDQKLIEAITVELIEKNGIEFRYKALYVRELVGHCWSGMCEDGATDEVLKKETLLWFVIEQEYYDVAYALINQYNARVNLSVKKLITRRISTRRTNKRQKEEFLTMVEELNCWRSCVLSNVEDNYEELEKFAKKLKISIRFSKNHDSRKKFPT